MFGCHLVIILAFSMLLFGGALEAGAAIMAFVYPVISFIFLIADIFFTTFTTDLIIHFKKEARILLIIIRDGWIKQERNQIERGKRSTIRNPKGKVLAHPRGKEAAKGYSYKESQLQLESNHKLQHKYDNNGRRNIPQ